MSTFQGFLHPHHVSLTRQPYSIRTLLHSFSDHVDPYYVYDDITRCKGFSAPRFNVNETETNYFLDGELPGVEDKTSINVIWLQNQVLVIHGAIDSADTMAAADPVPTDMLKKEHIKAPVPLKTHSKATTNTTKAIFPRRLLHERHLGPFERSFTFPDEVERDDMKASLKDGLLSIIVPKKIRSTTSEKRVNVD